MGFTDPYTVAAALSGLVVVWVVLLYAHRRIPRLPPPDSINELRHDFFSLADQFAEFVEKHDEQMGRHYAKVGALRRKLRRLQEEEGAFEDGDEEGGDPAAPAAPPPVLIPPSREELKHAARVSLATRRGVA